MGSRRPVDDKPVDPKDGGTDKPKEKQQ